MGSVTRLNPRGEFGEVRAGRPTTTNHIRQLKCSDDVAGFGLVVDLTDLEEAVVHAEDEPVIGEFHQDQIQIHHGDDDFGSRLASFF
ncbi:hypothetical protein Bca52824_006425 [Brassica carinata]|uniref:Uncharacterized protein n=1 Tax=Brassica carinata TaxID=52824 RepID=A0A8X8B757_BRACI|nr:hypothetical protein Bca52824_006425 [Brassica carinata]